MAVAWPWVIIEEVVRNGQILDIVVKEGLLTDWMWTVRRCTIRSQVCDLNTCRMRVPFTWRKRMFLRRVWDEVRSSVLDMLI